MLKNSVFWLWKCKEKKERNQRKLRERELQKDENNLRNLNIYLFLKKFLCLGDFCTLVSATFDLPSRWSSMFRFVRFLARNLSGTTVFNLQVGVVVDLSWFLNISFLTRVLHARLLGCLSTYLSWFVINKLQIFLFADLVFGIVALGLRLEFGTFCALSVGCFYNLLIFGYSGFLEYYRSVTRSLRKLGIVDLPLSLLIYDCWSMWGPSWSRYTVWFFFWVFDYFGVVFTMFLPSSSLYHDVVLGSTIASI